MMLTSSFNPHSSAVTRTRALYRPPVVSDGESMLGEERPVYLRFVGRAGAQSKQHL